MSKESAPGSNSFPPSSSSSSSSQHSYPSAAPHFPLPFHLQNPGPTASQPYLPPPQIPPPIKMPPPFVPAYPPAPAAAPVAPGVYTLPQYQQVCPRYPHVRNLFNFAEVVRFWRKCCYFDACLTFMTRATCSNFVCKKSDYCCRIRRVSATV